MGAKTEGKKKRGLTEEARERRKRSLCLQSLLQWIAFILYQTMHYFIRSFLSISGTKRSIMLRGRDGDQCFNATRCKLYCIYSSLTSSFFPRPSEFRRFISAKCVSVCGGQPNPRRLVEHLLSVFRGRRSKHPDRFWKRPGRLENRMRAVRD